VNKLRWLLKKARKAEKQACFFLHDDDAQSAMHPMPGLFGGGRFLLSGPAEKGS
jgi:hypothetical protein